MKALLRSFSPASELLGFYPGDLFYAIQGLPFFIRDFVKIKKQKGNDSEFNFWKKYLFLGGRLSEPRTITRNYFHQDLLVAKKIYLNRPKCHVDIGSGTDGFVSHLSAFREVEVLGKRVQSGKVENIIFIKSDLMHLSEDMIDYCDSISALHSTEHFGFGGYSDEIDFNDYSVAIANIYSMLKSGGKFYFSVPIGSQRNEFSSQRIFSLYYLLNLFKEKFCLNNFSYVNDGGDLYENVELTERNIATNLNCESGCGIFELAKL